MEQLKPERAEGVPVNPLFSDCLPRLLTLPRLLNLPWLLRKSAAVLFGLMLVSGCSGCLLGALPLAIDAAEGVGSAVANGALGAVVEAHQGSTAAADKDHPGEDPMAREDRCSELSMDAPNVIELHNSAAGAPEYRELQLGGSLGHPLWEPIVGQDTNTQGWRPAVHFLQMNFNPPLGPLPQSGSDYIAYRPLQTDSGPNVQFAPLSVNFGERQGTFVWDGATYEFAAGHSLPCFPHPRQ